MSGNIGTKPARKLRRTGYAKKIAARPVAFSHPMMPDLVRTPGYLLYSR